MIGLFDLFLGLVADAGTTGRANRATDDSTGRTGDRATDERTRGGTTEGTRAGSGLVVAFGQFTGHGTRDRTDPAADDGADRPANDGTDTGARERPGTRADGLGPGFFILDRRSIRVVDVVIQRIRATHVAVVPEHVVVVVHWGLLSTGSAGASPEPLTSGDVVDPSYGCGGHGRATSPAGHVSDT